jgi:hypothetical protein
MCLLQSKVVDAADHQRATGLEFVKGVIVGEGRPVS